MRQGRNVLAGGLCALSLCVWASTAADAISGHVLSLDGDRDYMEVADSPALHSAAAVTITAWFRVDDFQRSWQALFWKGDLPDSSPYGNREFGLYQRSLGYVHLTSTPVSRQKVGHLYLDTPGGAVKPGQWYHVAAVVNSVSNYMKIFVNGEQMASRPYDGSGIRDSIGPFKLGGIPHRDADFHGLLDEVRVWNRALSSVEIRHNMNRTLTGDEPGLVAYYDFEQLDEQGLVPDISGSGHRGRLQGDAHLRTIQVFMPPVAVAARARLQTLAAAVMSEPPAEAAQAEAPAVRPAATELVLPSTTTTSPGADGQSPTTMTTTTTQTVPVVLQAQVGAPPAAPQEEPPAAAPTPAPVARAPEPRSALIAGDAADLLMGALRHHDATVRRTAAEGLDRLHPSVFTPVMEVALNSHDSQVRRRAAQVLVDQSPDRWQPWWGEVDGDDIMVVRGETVQALADAVRASLAEELGSAKQAPEAIQRDRYRGWEYKWSAARPDFWDLEREGALVHYNRAEGLFAGWRLQREYKSPTGMAHYGEGGYSFGSQDWRFQAGGELFTFYGPPSTRSNLVAIGAEVHDLTDSQDSWLISQEENTVDALIFRRDFRDYYRRSGWSVYSSHNIGGVLQLSGRYGRDDFESMDNTTEWIPVGSRYARDEFRPNPAIDEGMVSSLRADIQLDTRSQSRDPWQGWFVNALLERSGGFLEGDYEFKRYLLDVRRYQPLGLGTRMDLRLRTGTAKGDLPSQYLYDLGGYASLRGYSFKEFTGDRMVLLNMEYWVDADRHWGGSWPVDGVGVGVFFDAGSAWFARDRSDPFEGVTGLIAEGGSTDTDSELRRSVGLALGASDQGFRVDFARPLDGDGDQNWRVSARFSRSF